MKLRWRGRASCAAAGIAEALLDAADEVALAAVGPTAVAEHGEGWAVGSGFCRRGSAGSGDRGRRRGGCRLRAEAVGDVRAWLVRQDDGAW